ncbi:DUF1593 domain-containing protein [Fibrella aquatilis]|uniref:DUF1593 domain-containing protein n=1 Tax=Fibrella aquatilis TaxID=2817059 RepID=A0A939GDE1_9BACT|nr:DUF1593 domain-containing protein [Fibrella aquatilis]MBO0934323.1 DUF1593 domain-containing protein [Fibrella aquatilis]
MMNMYLLIYAFASIILLFQADLLAQHKPANRLIVLTDIEADPDDAQSLIRLLTYANEVDIEGLIATTSMFQKRRVAPETIHRLVNIYGKVQPNLLLHAKGYPTAVVLNARVKQGVALYGMEGVGAGNDSEGSAWIIAALEKPDARPLWVSVWGGPNCLGQALWTIQHTRSPEQAARLYKKLRVYAISDQDDSGVWIRKTFPDVFYIVSPSFTGATWGGITRNNAGADNEANSNDWIARHIQQGHGPLGAAYPDVAYGMEGDTPAYLNLIPNGLHNAEHPNYGGWGGRYELATPAPETRPIWTNADDIYAPLLPRAWGRPLVPDTVIYTSAQATVWRWRTECQNDFAARIDWTTKPYKGANHPPVPKLNHPDRLTVKSGALFKLDADGTYDPDGDSMSYYWFQYPEAGTYRGKVPFTPFSPNLYNMHTLVAPKVDSPQTAHFILKVTDKGSPALTRYKRVIVEFVP